MAIKRILTALTLRCITNDAPGSGLDRCCFRQNLLKFDNTATISLKQQSGSGIHSADPGLA
jgi:hypothetical protein